MKVMSLVISVISNIQYPIFSVAYMVKAKELLK